MRLCLISSSCRDTAEREYDTTLEAMPTPTRLEGWNLREWES